MTTSGDVPTDLYKLWYHGSSYRVTPVQMYPVTEKFSRWVVQNSLHRILHNFSCFIKFIKQDEESDKMCSHFFYNSILDLCSHVRFYLSYDKSFFEIMFVA